MPLAEKKKLRQVLSVYPTVSSYTPHFYFPHPLSFSLLFLNDFYINKLTHIVTHASFPFSISTSHHLYDHTTNDIATPLISTTTCSLVGYLPELTIPIFCQNNLCDSVLQFNQVSVHTMLSSHHSLPTFSQSLTVFSHSHKSNIPHFPPNYPKLNYTTSPYYPYSNFPS